MVNKSEIISITIQTEIDFTVDDIWPDGNAPEDFDAYDVKAALESYGSKYELLELWGLLNDLDVTVYTQGTLAIVWD
jgi:hypothetical protein